MYGNVDASLFLLSLFSKYLVRKCNLKSIKAGSYILLSKYDKDKLELMMLVYVEDLFMDDTPETLKNIKENIK